MASRPLPANFPRDGAASCERCASDSLKTFNGEVAVHFPGLEGLNKPIVWVFPRLTICLLCGFAEFVLPEEQRAKLGHDDFAAK